MNVGDQAAWKQMERGWVHGSAKFRDRMREGLLEEDKVSEELEQKRDLSEAAAGKVLFSSF